MKTLLNTSIQGNQFTDYLKNVNSATNDVQCRKQYNRKSTIAAAKRQHEEESASTSQKVLLVLEHIRPLKAKSAVLKMKHCISPWGKEDPGSGNLITFAQFVFVVVEGFIFTMKFGTKKPKIGILSYTVLVAMFFIVNVFNNYAFDFNVAMPLHMIFRAGSLIANMIMGIIILKKSYVFSKYFSVGLITLGIVICTIISGQDV
ncbi:hypothetical protein J6590_039440, partial [Homalodisca vitripennis]